MHDSVSKYIVDAICQLTNNAPMDYLINKYVWGKITNYEGIVEDNLFATCKDNIFYQNVLLKLALHKRFKEEIPKFLKDQSNNLINISKWIVKGWGGIKGIKDENLEKLVKQVCSEQVDYNFDNISSWSKIRAFKNIGEDVIYDSRVIYTINWLLLKSGMEAKFFVQPESRNSNLTKFPVTALINMKFCEDNSFLDKNNCYVEYRKLVQSINEQLWHEDDVLDLSHLKDYNSAFNDDDKIRYRDYPFFTEMILFSLAPNEIVEDIKKSVKIRIKT